LASGTTVEDLLCLVLYCLAGGTAEDQGDAGVLARVLRLLFLLLLFLPFLVLPLREDLLRDEDLLLVDPLLFEEDDEAVLEELLVRERALDATEEPLRFGGLIERPLGLRRDSRKASRLVELSSISASVGVCARSDAAAATAPFAILAAVCRLVRARAPPGLLLMALGSDEVEPFRLRERFLGDGEHSSSTSEPSARAEAMDNGGLPTLGAAGDISGMMLRNLLRRV